MATLVRERRHSMLGVIAKWWRAIGKRTGMTMLRHSDIKSQQCAACDASTKPEIQEALAGRWPESTDLLLRRMAALKLDAGEIGHMYPAASSDLKKLCWLCISKGRCEYDITNGPNSTVWREYCPNASTLTMLSAERDLQAKKD